jgi:hypothetical protein
MSGLLVPVLLFAISMSITPGPNNMLLTAAGNLVDVAGNLDSVVSELRKQVEQFTTE